MAMIDVNWKPPRKDLRVFSAIFLVGGTLAGIVFRFKFGWVLVPKILWVAAAIVGPVGLAFPTLVWPVYVALMAISLPIGLVVSTVVLAAIYYLVLTPIGLVARLVSYDPMGRRPDPAAQSFWIKRATVVEARRYFRQY